MSTPSIMILHTLFTQSFSHSCHLYFLKILFLLFYIFAFTAIYTVNCDSQKKIRSFFFELLFFLLFNFLHFLWFFYVFLLSYFYIFLFFYLSLFIFCFLSLFLSFLQKKWTSHFKKSQSISKSYHMIFCKRAVHCTLLINYIRKKKHYSFELCISNEYVA